MSVDTVPNAASSGSADPDIIAPPPRQRATLSSQLAEELKRVAYESPSEQSLRSVIQLLNEAGVQTLRPLLPILFSIKDQPYTLDDHEQFYPFFRTLLPTAMLFKTGRQTGKSQQQATSEVLVCGSIPHFTWLHVMPLFEHTRRYSANYVRPLVDYSPFRRLFHVKKAASVLQRSFPNNSNLLFSFAFANANHLALSRLRGVPADGISEDELQDLDPSHLPVIEEALGASPWKLIRRTGTPKGLANPVETNWLASSRAEWVVTCPRCHYDNVPSLAGDLYKMMGPWHKDISEERPGTICAKCRRTINPRHNARYVHGNSDLAERYPGFHVPQQIMPFHFADPRAWKSLLAKRDGAGNMTDTQFLNEVCGESSDSGTSLVTLTDIRRAATLNENTIDKAVKRRKEYSAIYLGCDWGGGGQEGRSLTAMAVVGMLPNGELHVIYGHRSRTPYDHEGEARICLYLINKFGISHMAHDFNGIGATRETFLVQSGFPLSRIVPIAYHRRLIGKPLCQPHPPSEYTPRAYFLVDRSRSLQLLSTQIKHQKVKFFKYDYKGQDEQGLLHDFLSLHEHYVETGLGDEIYTVIHDARLSDDFAHAVNFAAVAMWQTSGRWPKIVPKNMALSAEEMARFHPENPDAAANQPQ